MSDDSDDEFANSDVDAEAKYVCKICQPNVTFVKTVNLIRHMRNKNVHPDVVPAYSTGEFTYDEMYGTNNITLFGIMLPFCALYINSQFIYCMRTLV